MSVPNSRWSTGRATLTTVLSINVMLDPKTVAASTHGAARLGHGASAAPARITASSHGALKAVVNRILSRPPVPFKPYSTANVRARYGASPFRVASTYSERRTAGSSFLSLAPSFDPGSVQLRTFIPTGRITHALLFIPPEYLCEAAPTFAESSARRPRR